MGLASSPWRASEVERLGQGGRRGVVEGGGFHLVPPAPQELPEAPAASRPVALAGAGVSRSGGDEEGVMAIERLDHYSIRTTDVEARGNSIRRCWASRSGRGRTFPFPGVWLYQGGIAVVHVVGIDPNDTNGLQDYLGDRGAAGDGTGSIDHVAFVGRDFEGMRAQFQGANGAVSGAEGAQHGSDADIRQ